MSRTETEDEAAVPAPTAATTAASSNPPSHAEDEGGTTMAKHRMGSAAEHLEARLELLAAEKEVTRLNDELARRRRELPWVRIAQEYRFDTEGGEATLADLFGGRSQLIVDHFMYGPDWDEGCPSCSSVADGFDETYLHLLNHDIAFTAVSRASLDKLLAYRTRMGWSFPWASSGRSDFNFDFNVSFTEESVARGGSYNFKALEGWQVDPANLPFEGPGMSAFALADGVVYHTYSAYSRGLDGLWNMWQWLDRAPLGRNEGDYSWFRRHDRYGEG